MRRGQLSVRTWEGLFLLCSALLFAAWLRYAQNVAWLETLVFYAALLTVFYLPGDLIRLLARTRPSGLLCGFVESTGLGLALVPLVYLMVRRCGCEVAMPYVLVVVVAIWAVAKAKRKGGLSAVATSNSWQVMAGFALLAVVVIALLQFSHYTDFVRADDAVYYRNAFTTETVYHQGIVNALKYEFPPQDIYGSGGKDFSSYHLLMHLEIELVNRLFGVDTENLIYYYFPTIYFLFISLFAYILFVEFFGSPIAGLLCGVAVYASDFSYIPGLMELGVARQPEYPWIYYYPTIWSLFTLNGILPAIFVLFLALIYLRRYFDQQRWQDVIVFFSLVFASTGFKTSLGLHLLGVSFLTGALVLLKPRAQGARYAFLLATVVTAACVVLEVVVFRGGTGDAVVRVSPFNQFDGVMLKLGISDVSFWLFPLAYVVFLLGVFGVRIGIFWFLFRLFRREVDFFVLFLLAFILSGFALSEFIFLGHADAAINDGVWFAIQALTCAWVLFSILFHELGSCRSLKIQLLAVVLVLGVSFPSTIEFLSKRSVDNYFAYNQNASDLVGFFGDIENDSVIMNPLTMAGPSIASNLSGRTTFLSMYMSFRKDEKVLRDKMQTVNSFFSPLTTVDEKRMVLSNTGVNYIYATSMYSKMLSELPFLNLVHSNSQYLVYKVEDKDKT